MLFPKNKLIPVKYIIDTDEFPLGVYPNIEPYPNKKQLGCPAVNSTNNKLFYVNSPASFTLEFGVKDNEPFYNYNYDTKIHGINNKVHNFIKNSLELQYFKDTMNIQILMPYAFVTDNTDLTVMTVPPPLDYNNCTYASGELYIANWIRHLNVALVLTDNSKPASVSFSVNQPALMFAFNKQIDLQYTEQTDVITKYLKQTKDIVNYRKGIMNLYKQVVSRRPKKLL